MIQIPKRYIPYFYGRFHKFNSILFDSPLIPCTDHLVGETLSGEDKIESLEFFYNEKERQIYGIVQLGKKLCGHQGILHGGATATILDEILGSLSMWTAENKDTFTANLNVNYRKPILLPALVVVSGKVDKLEGRKIYITGAIHPAEDSKTVLADATMLAIIAKENS